MLTDEQLTELGRTARQQYDEMAGNCRDIALTVKQLAEERHGVQIGVRELQVGEQRDTHFVNTLRPEDYAGEADARVLIDASLDQFCSENQHKDGVRVNFGPRTILPEVAIYPPGAEERHIWYYRPNAKEEGLDVFTGDPAEQ